MSLAFQRFKVYLRIALVVMVVTLAAVVLFMNRNHTVLVWFFGLTNPEKPVNVVWVILWTAMATRTVWWFFTFGHGLLRDWKSLQREQAMEELMRTQQEARKQMSDAKSGLPGDTKESTSGVFPTVPRQADDKNSGVI